MRRRIWSVIWKHWKRVRTRWRYLEKLGISHSNAGILVNSRKGYWRIANSPILNAALTNERLEMAGYQFLRLITNLSRHKLMNRRIPNGTYGDVRGRLTS